MRAALLVCVLAGCAPTPPSTSLYAHPWPDERLRGADGALDLSGFPGDGDDGLRAAALESLEGADGVGLTAPVLFPFDAPLDPASLPSVEDSVTDAASVFVVDVDPSSPRFGERAPVDVRFLDDGGPFGGTNLLVVLPYPGIPLRPRTLYAAVVTTAVRGRGGDPLPASDAPATGLHARVDETLASLGVEVAARAVVRTAHPTDDLRVAVAQALAEEPVTLSAPQLVETHDDYCVFASSVEMPVYQRGEPPYRADGGGWARGPGGSLERQRLARSRVWITVPRVVADPYPAAVLVRVGAGGDRPLVDRGPRDGDGHSAPGTGLARELAQAGYVGLSVDGPLGGARNPEGWDEQTAIFNVANPVALRDNVRQTALELVLFAHAIEALRFDAGACDGAAGVVTLAPRPVLVGHSSGATIAPLAMAVEPRFGALVLSGAGASWIRQIVHKQSPAPMRPVAELLMGYWPHRALIEHDPLLGLLQWAGEPADPVVYGPAIRDRPVLVFQGVLDTYIPPPIANPLALSLGLELAGPALDEGLPWRSAADDLALLGGGRRGLPVEMSERPRVLTQHLPDGIEDGHEVLFQRADARRQLRCFLESLHSGRPRLVRPGPLDEPCR